MAALHLVKLACEMPDRLGLSLCLWDCQELVRMLVSAEVESALVAHPIVAEAAVVGFPHEIKGQGIYAYVTLNAERQPSDELRKELIQWVRKEIGAIASPDFIQRAPSLPKTRSGKIMRRILRKIAANEISDLIDTSTLAEPAVVEDLIKNRLAAVQK